MRPSPRPASTMLNSTEVVEVAVASMIQDTMKGKDDKIIALFLPRESAKSPPTKEVDADENAQAVANNGGYQSVNQFHLNLPNQEASSNDIFKS